MRDLAFFLAGVAFTVAAALLTVLPWSRDLFDRRRHVRDVRARLQPVWEPIADHGWVLRSVRLVVHNSGRWPAREVLVLTPSWVATRDRAEVAPNDPWIEDVFLNDAARKEYDDPVTLQLVDVRGRMWRWTSMTDELQRVPTPIPMHARLVQWTARRYWTSRMHERFARLPKRWQARLWGYDPEG